MNDYTERIQVGNYPIPRGDFDGSSQRCFTPVYSRIYGLTTFEITTAVAFQYFKHQHIDIGVIEVGLGGRLDATNIIHPQVSVIASISLDHTAIPGQYPGGYRG
jgi:dihydrofolate synthase/folylpolyglutamate synthase